MFNFTLLLFCYIYWWLFSWFWGLLNEIKTVLMSFLSFKVFLHEITNQFGIPFKIWRTDNARKYLSCQFESFLTSQGIFHQTSCAHTPQQSDIAKHKSSPGWNIPYHPPWLSCSSPLLGWYLPLIIWSIATRSKVNYLGPDVGCG